MQLGFTNEHRGIKLSAHVSEENGYEIENKKKNLSMNVLFTEGSLFRDLTL